MPFLILIVGITLKFKHMLYSNTLSEITYNVNTGVEYEIALFYCLLTNNNERSQVMSAINKRENSVKINRIIKQTDITEILQALQNDCLELIDVTFETQNDEVGPADVVMKVKDKQGRGEKKIGISVKYANSCTLNVTGRNFLTDTQISDLKDRLAEYTVKYIKEMESTYGDVKQWFRKRKPSNSTDQYIDLIRDAVIANWNNVCYKTTLLSALFHSDSPIEYWVATYNKKGYSLNTCPQTIDLNRVDDITLEKYQTSYIGFFLDGAMVGRMQVKFNNGFVEKCKKKQPDINYKGVKMSYGQPFSSWNFSV